MTEPDGPYEKAVWKRDEKGRMLPIFKLRAHDNGVGVVAGWKDKGVGFTEEEKNNGKGKTK